MNIPLRATLCRIYVGNIPWTVGKQELKGYFSQFGLVTNASVLFDKKTGMHKKFGFVSFRTQAEVDAALNVPIHKLEGNVLKVELQG